MITGTGTKNCNSAAVVPVQFTIAFLNLKILFYANLQIKRSVKIRVKMTYR
jgi:hypothetical protein